MANPKKVQLSIIVFLTASLLIMAASSLQSLIVEAQYPIYQITVTQSSNGVINPATAYYLLGTDQTETITPNSGYFIANITVDGSPVTVTSPSGQTVSFNDIQADHSVTATFVQNEYALSVSTVGSGSVSKVPNQATYHYGDIVTLTATPAAGWSFSGWNGDATGSTNPLTVTMTSTKTITATFTQNSYSLTVNTAGSGSVTKNPNLSSYLSGTSVTLTATPAAGWSFSGWSGDATGSTNPLTVTMTSTKTITATFSQNTYSVVVTVNPSSAAGTVTPNATGPYHYGDKVVLMESPNNGYAFSSWSGDGAGTGTTRTVTVTDNMAVTATFVQNEYALSVSTVGTGSVSKSPNQASYHYGDTVVLTATSQGGWSFAGWSGGFVSSANPVSVKINGTTSVTATFTKNSYVLSVSTVGSGSVSKSPNEATYSYGDSVVLTASPAVGWSFGSWSGDGTGSGVTRTVVVTGNMAVTATFVQNEYALSVSTVGTGSVSKSPNQASYHYGDTVVLTANAPGGWSFAGWSGGFVSSANPVSVKINGTTSVTATFFQIMYKITFATSGGGSTSPSSSQNYVPGTSVDITAIPASGYSFTSWRANPIGSVYFTDSSSALTKALINGNGTITATFVQNEYTLSVSTVGSGSVSKSLNKPTYHYDDVVVLTAIPAAGWSFSAWSGPFANSLNPVTIRINNTIALTATFTQNRYDVVFASSGSGTTSPTGTRNYPAGTIVDITAIAANGYSFSSWSTTGSINFEDASSASTTATINGAGTITASFDVASSTPTPTQNPTSPPTQTIPATTPKPTSKPSTTTATPSPTIIEPPSSIIISHSILATASDGSKTYLTIQGNINGSDISDATITTDQTTPKTTLTLTFIGQSGSNSYCNITIPKNAIPYGTIPAVYINNQITNDQAYAEDTNNYYVRYNADFSTYELSVIFSVKADFPLLVVALVVILSIVLVVAIVMPRLGLRLGLRSIFLHH